MSFYRAIVTVGGLTLGSRIFGFLRDIVTAAFLGTGPIADAFFVALKLPNFFRRITAEGAFSVSFVPLFSGQLEQRGRAEAIKFAEEAQAMMFTILMPFTIFAIVCMPWVLHVIAPGFAGTPERYALALELSRITFPYILLMSMTSLLGGVMNSFDRFGPFAAAPILFNLSLIAALVFLTPWVENGGYAMAWGVSVSGVLQFAYLYWSCRRMGVILRIRKPVISPRIRNLFKNMVPGVFGAGLAQVNLLIDLMLASFLPVGAISFLYYADRLYQLPLSVIGTAVGTALLPMLSRALKSGNGAQRLFTRGFETSLMLGLPAAVAYIAVAPTMMEALFVRGAFTIEDSRAAAAALMAYAVGLPAFVLAKVFNTVFYAQEDTRTPVKYAIVCAIMNTALAIALIKPMGHVGIALATGVTAWVNVILLLRGLWKRNVFLIEKSSIRSSGIIVAASAVMGVILYVADIFITPHMAGRGETMRATGLITVLATGGLFYAAVLWRTGILHPRMIKELFSKTKKTDTIGVEEKNAPVTGE